MDYGNNMAIKKKQKKSKIVIPSSAARLKDSNEIHDYYQKIISLMPNNVYWLDRNCITQGCNENVLKLVGLDSLDQFVGITYEEMGKLAGWTEGQAESFKKDDMEVMATGIAKLNIEEPPLYDDKGNPVYYMSSRVPLLDDKKNIIGVVGISVDITARIKMEENLRQEKERAEAASHAKTMFLANMSHDIKTPIAGIISTAEYLTHSIEDDENNSRADDIVKSGFRLLEMMVEIIEISRLEVRQTERTQLRFNFQKLIDDIVQLIKPSFIEKPFKLKVDYAKNIPNFLIGDRWHLYRVILNLLSNAIKFTKKGSITIKVAPIKQTKKKITLKISVQDTGMGIPKEKQATIFDNFTRLTPSYEGIYKGTGLGLYIVKQFIEAMKGKITVESEEGKGSSFNCIIPFKIAPSQEEDISESKKLLDTVQPIENANLPILDIKEVPTSNELRILLVEDNLIASRTAKSILETLGCKVDTAFTGSEAIKLFDVGKYHLIYMDLGLPDFSGTEVTEQIRQIEGDTKKSIIIALSAHIDNEIKTSCLIAGMNDITTKPLLRDQVIQFFKQIGGKNFIIEEKRIVNNNKSSSNPKNKTIDNESKIINLESGSFGIDSNHETAKELLTMLCETLPGNVEKIQAALETNDLDTMVNIAHKLHGGLSYCGTPRLQKAVRKLELEAKSATHEQLKALFDNVSAETRAFINEYNEMFTKDKK